jgi:nitroimidazol reductase NimA-like FMN-containing flavoprotein (pyridoxamine 5'-phosphate oxidase superfamily)
VPTPTPKLDRRFSDPAARPTPWPEVTDVLDRAELYWLSTVRADGRPHVTPLIGVRHDGAMHFTTGPREQKFRNLEQNPKVALTTGANTWAAGLDVVVEGVAVRVSDNAELQRVADAIEAKYGSVWHFEVGDGAFGDGERVAALFRVEAAKVMAFAKAPHGHTTFRFDAG